jgi:Na+/H+ antiporter NhaD/arsenite permease-like protein
VAFISHAFVHLEPSVVALVGGLVLLGASRVRPEDVAQDVEWPTLMFFAGLFVMVGALVNTGAIDLVSRRATELSDGRLAAASVGLLWGSAVVSALVDNIPYVATMSPVTEELVAAEGGGPQARSLWWSLALGADLGGNATAVGASANVIVIGLAEKAGYRISFWGFTKYGLIVAVVTLAVATPYVLLRYFFLA